MKSLARIYLICWGASWVIAGPVTLPAILSTTGEEFLTWFSIINVAAITAIFIGAK